MLISRQNAVQLSFNDNIIFTYRTYGIRFDSVAIALLRDYRYITSRAIHAFMAANIGKYTQNTAK